MSARTWAMLLALSVLWGGSFLFIGIAVRELPPLTLVFARVVIASAILVGVAVLMRLSFRLTGAIALTLLGMSVLNNVIPFTLIVWAQGSIPSGLASILNATTPLFTVAMLHAATDEKAGRLKIFGVVIGFLGVAVMMGRDLGALGGSALLPQAAVLGAAMSYALSGLWSRRFARQGIPPLVAAAGQLFCSTLLLAPLMLVVDRPWLLPIPSLQVTFAVLALALLSTALAYILFFRILALAGATNLSLVTFLIPVSAILLGIVVLNESLNAAQIAGMLLIGMGLALIDGRLFRHEEAS
ncbi:MAG: DMT family transporter [Rhizobiales bacterium]|nr:DMT family transporter [Hyphomicrobiales bacterium]